MYIYIYIYKLEFNELNTSLILILLFLNLFLDGIDGVYARKFKLSTNFGAFFDFFIDHLSFLLVGLCLIILTEVNILLLFLFILSYEIMVFLFIIIKILNIKNSFFMCIRVKYLIFLFMTLSLFFNVSIILNYFILIASIYHMIMVCGFLSLIKREIK